VHAEHRHLISRREQSLSQINAITMPRKRADVAAIAIEALSFLSLQYSRTGNRVIKGSEKVI
jgi:hypothetical protein